MAYYLYNRQNADRHMLGVLRVKSHAHWMVMVDGSPSCERVLKAMKASGKNISNFRFGGHRDLVKSLNNVF